MLNCIPAQESYAERPFEGFEINDTSFLYNLTGRQPCPNCGKSRKIFCYTCFVPIREVDGKLPKVKLPLKIDIIKHKHEIDGKSTASHAALLAHDDVKIYTYPDIPNYEKENVVLIFPGQGAVSVNQLVRETTYENLIKYQKSHCGNIPKGHNQTTLLKTISSHSRNESRSKVAKLSVSKAIFIDSTWHQCKSIYKDERLRVIPCVVIENRISQFWRHQKGSPRWYLATIEAIHQFVLEIHLHCWGLNPNYKGIKNCFTENDLGHIQSFYTANPKGYCGQYDNLLYFFKYMYDTIHKYYRHEDLYSYKRRLT
ncbi:tRNA-uridine aminocarboxypropyltransferase 1 [Cylas formicarius]|uniref:tRNA-uridine aminocarboxypropyltransferase 1 n=1 Tax=Cylas formicarius TaxID=197179 RepID=UPI0029589FCA|nr:tRNA-uridine aminocarboxypropyltransferase 1 [Cylas formicarius]